MGKYSVGSAETDARYLLRPMRLETEATAVSSLMVEYLTWGAGRLSEEYGLDESPADLGAVGDSLRAYAPPAGLILVAERDGSLIGIGALRTLEPEIVEVKRMYVVPRERGHHVGAGILDNLLLEARRTFRATTVRLDSCRFMTEAQQLYRSRNFIERSPYIGTEIPPHLQKYWRFFELNLADTGEPVN
jgi:predicted GNAT family N-acyltransferase